MAYGCAFLSVIKFNEITILVDLYFGLNDWNDKNLHQPPRIQCKQQQQHSEQQFAYSFLLRQLKNTDDKSTVL